MFQSAKEAGYIVTDGEIERTIYGIGSTAGEAITAAIRYLTKSQVHVVGTREEAQELSERGGDTMLASDLLVYPATQELLDAVEHRGGALVWDLVDHTATIQA